jgi:genome maintenance exonuclease 1
MKQVKPFKHNLSLQLELNKENTELGRMYVLPTGRRLPSVTTVLGWAKRDSLVEWRRRVGEEEANKISSKAAIRGTKVHAVCEKFLRNEENFLAGCDIGTIDLFNTLYPILNERIDDINAIETPLYSEHLGVAGTVDCIARFDGKRSVIDFKTSNRPKKAEWIDNYFMQTACYGVMFEELTGIAVPNLVIIVAVDNDEPQIFIEKRDTWIDSAIKVIQEYRDFHGIA